MEKTCASRGSSEIASGALSSEWGSANGQRPLVILRIKEVLKKIGRSRASLYALMDRRSRYYDPTFPQPIRLSPHGSAVGWIEAEVEDWLFSRVLATRSA